MSAILTRIEETRHAPVYYISKCLVPIEERFSLMEKFGLALVMAARKLRPYPQSHPIVVVIEHPIKTVLHRSELSSRMVKWVVELSEHDITFRHRSAVKALV